MVDWAWIELVEQCNSVSMVRRANIFMVFLGIIPLYFDHLRSRLRASAVETTSPLADCANPRSILLNNKIRSINFIHRNLFR